MTNEDQTRPQAQQTRFSTAPTAPSARSTDETQELTAAPTKLELSPAQIAGSALAAVSSAFFASWAGTAGTLIGVAAGSVIATVGAATYTWWLRRTQEAVRRRAALVRQTTLAANGLPRTVAVGPLRRRGDREADATRQDLTAVPGDEPVDPSPTDEEPLPGRWALPWKKVLLTSVAVMLLALAVITGFEAITGRTVASYTGGNGGSGSTVGNVLGEDSSTQEKQPSERSTPTPTPTPSPSSSPTDGATDGTQDGTDGTDGTGGTGGTTPAPTPTPTVPTPSSGTTPTPGVPDSTSTPDSGSTALP